MNRTLVTNHQELGDPVSDNRLSWAARGLYAWMERYRPDLIAASQQVVYDAVVLHGQTGRGREAVAKSLKELRSLGYLPPLRQTPPPSESVRGKPGFVYLIRISNGIYKIGASRNPKQRLKAIRFKLQAPDADLFHIIATDDMGGLEEQLHQRFDQYRIEGGFETFSLPFDSVVEICAMEDQSDA